MAKSNQDTSEKEKFSIDPKTVEAWANEAFNESRADAFRKLLKLYYDGSLYGPSIVKRHYGEIQQIASLIFTPERLILEGRFNHPEEVTDIEKRLLKLLVSEVENNFYTVHGLDTVITQAVEASLVLGTAPVKVYWTGYKAGGVWIDQGVKYRFVLPENLGVLYESLPIDDTQQVIAHRTYMTAEKIKHIYGVTVQAEGKQPQSSSAYRLLMIPGEAEKSVGVMTESFICDYEPRNAKPLHEVIEVFFNEEPYTGINRWHRVDYIPTVGCVRHLSYGNLRHPFFLFVPMPSLKSVWGVSILDLIKDIQIKRDEIMKQIDLVRDLKRKPPLIVSGANISADQIRSDMQELYTPGGVLVIQDMSCGIHPVNLIDLTALYNELEYLNQQVRFITQLQSVLVGEQPRGKGTANIGLIAAFASSSFRKMANFVERTLEEIFTYTADLIMLNDSRVVMRENGANYRFSNITHEFRIEVQSHSASPIDLQQTQNLILMLFQAGMVSPKVLLDVFNLPFKQEILEDIEKKALLAALAAEEEKKKGG